MNTYLIDTSAIIDDADILNSFNDGVILLSTTVIRELDGLKESKRGNVSSQAVKAINFIDGYRKLGNLSTGVEIEGGSVLQVASPPENSEVYVDFGRTSDTEIIATASAHIYDQCPVTVISADTNFRIIASLIGYDVFDYVSKRQQAEHDSYKGYIEIDDEVLRNSLHTQSTVPLSRLVTDEKLYDGMYVVIGRDWEHYLNLTIAKVTGDFLTYVPDTYGQKVGRFTVKNLGQRILALMLLDSERTVVTVEGLAGTGKTLEALAYSLKQTEDGEYNRVVCYRAIADLDEGLGALPGSLEEKLSPWIQPIYDNLEVLGEEGAVIRKFDDGTESDGLIEVAALTYARGRSLPKVIIIVDEAQNLTRLQAKTLATRLGAYAKIIFLYDPSQIDHRFLDRWNNGGVHVATSLRGTEIHAHVKLTETVRSKTAAICAELL